MEKNNRTFEPSELLFLPGDKVYTKIEGKVYEGKVTLTSIYYDERHTEPLQVVNYRIYV